MQVEDISFIPVDSPQMTKEEFEKYYIGQSNLKGPRIEEVYVIGSQFPILILK
jgi:hypothetical protein